jgi:hypothetical protein
VSLLAVKENRRMMMEGIGQLYKQTYGEDI